MELRQLEFVVALADELHFGRAARSCHVSTSVLSEQVRRLERELGVSLFERTTHRVALTDSGAAFLAEARDVLRSARRAVQVARSPGGARTLRVLGCESVFDMAFEPAAVLRERMPGVSLDIDAGPNLEIMRRFGRGELDLAIGLPSPPAQRLPTVADAPLRYRRTGVCLGAADPLAARPEVELADLVDGRLMLGSEEYSPEYNEMVTALFDSAGLELRGLPNQSKSLTWVLPAAVASGECGVVVPEGVVPIDGVVWRPIAGAPPLVWTLMWLESADAPVLAAVDALLDHARVAGWLTAVPAGAEPMAG